MYTTRPKLALIFFRSLRFELSAAEAFWQMNNRSLVDNNSYYLARCWRSVFLLHSPANVTIILVDL